MKRSEIAVLPCHRILKKAGAKRISKEAAEQLAVVLEEIGTKIAKSALQYAMHSRRETLQDVDVEVAARKLMRRRHQNG